MVFSDQAFVFVFLPVALACCLILGRFRLFNAAILVFSLIFFYWESGVLTLILLFSIALNYVGGLVIGRLRHRAVLAAFLAVNLGVLAYFKYAAFLLGAFDFFGDASLRQSVGGIVLPIGISFYTFQGISYLVDVWRGDVRPEPNLVTFAAYKAFFPQLIAGPIVRYADVGDDFHRPRLSLDGFAAGAARFMLGLLKKVIVADTVAPVANAAFFSGEELTFASSWLGAVAFAIQIYFDFSGYSDMAIGLALMFGIRFKENFNHPYAASTLTEFWRRWHMSLSSWFRDYLYIPLGGNRAGRRRTYVNLLAVFAATGIWHGAAWNFVFWGLYNGAFLIFERLTRLEARSGAGLRLLYFFPVILVGWSLFQVPDLHRFGAFASNMISPAREGAFALNGSMILALSPQSVLALAFGTLAAALQGVAKPAGLVLQDAPGLPAKAGRLGFIAVTAVVAAIYVLPQSFSPFLYFRF